jgi:phosphoglycolate phosphatase-like HAD superfamily hydrolase
MSINIKCNDHIYQDIETVLLNVDGTLLNYNELWLKQIGYLAQRLAEMHSETRGELFRIRAMLTKVLGVDPETEEIDFTGPFFSCDESQIFMAIGSILYINNVSWQKTFESIEKIVDEMKKELDITAYTSVYADSLEFLEYFTKLVKVITFSRRSFEDTSKLLKHFNLCQMIEKHCDLSLKVGNTSSGFIENLCIEHHLTPEKTLLIADSLNDLSINENISLKRLAINRNLADNSYYKNFHLQQVIKNFKDVEEAV